MRIKEEKIKEFLEMPLNKNKVINCFNMKSEEFVDTIYDERGWEEKSVQCIRYIYNDELKELIDFMISKNNIFTYCDKCRKELSFKLKEVEIIDCVKDSVLGGGYIDFVDEDSIELDCKESLESKIEKLIDNNKYFTKEIQCTHNTLHKQIFYYKLEKLDNKLILKKIGQDPSFLELNFYEYDNKYRKLKFYGQIKEDFKKSIHSYYDGLGIGAFIYLRRVLEKIIEYKFNEVNNKLTKDEVIYFKKKGQKFSEKVKILKEYLPEYLTANHQIYSILSEGVHKLSEEEVNKYFETIKKCIYIILDDLLYEQEQHKLRKSISDSLSNINTKIKSNKNLT
ncbi:hypothetical protein ACSXCO_00430 [Clostridium perfringens]|uniref:hypothetical protein n=1 Tax=Clostridium perfringens TaxID=1502 RepID=UPI003A213CBD